MFDREDDDEPHKSLDLGQARNTFLPSTLNAVETTTTQPSRKRKLIDIGGEQDVGEAFTIQVRSYISVKIIC